MEVKYLPHGKLAVIESICGHIGVGHHRTSLFAYSDLNVRVFFRRAEVVEQKKTMHSLMRM